MRPLKVCPVMVEPDPGRFEKQKLAPRFEPDGGVAGPEPLVPV